MSDLIRREDVLALLDSIYTEIENHFPSAEPERKKGRKFLGIVINYPKICTYPEYEGKPYYSIKYEENGDMIVGFGTYKPEVLSQYLQEYFISPAEPERKKGYWIVTSEFEDCRYVKCDQCKVTQVFYYNKPLTNFCPNCGAEMREEHEDIPMEYFENGEYKK